MRAVIQRVSSAEVRIAESVVAEIEAGLVVLLGVAVGDGEAEAAAMAGKIAGLRVFADDAGRMNLDLAETGGSVLLVSQFTLLADLRKGRRPSFVAAADPEDATLLIDLVATLLRERGVAVAEGEFGTHMEVELLNDGPVTIVIDAIDGSIQ